ncbi:MAG: 2-C-methyl-D-erythritol 2,4-cyclodiphosphate synthase [Oscillospiraceae bacterium]|nr:2-C-methyl-D-erythritol 2,4-cyclodiphosphate synthase [Oscillospiraceae bacterium]
MRIGHGYDVHRLVEGRRLILGGVDIPFKHGLSGHSDADVLAHALADALLGAAAEGDLGKLFPAGDAKYKDADSLELLKEVCDLIFRKGFKICNLDCTIVAQAPVMAPHIPAMRRKISEITSTEIQRVSVKATTEEGLGFTGTGQGIAAHAVVLLEEKLHPGENKPDFIDI